MRNIQTIDAVYGMLRRLNKTIVRNYAYSDIRYDLEQTENNLYSINEIDIMDTSQTLRDGLYDPKKSRLIKKTLCMNSLDNIYWILYSMCNALDNLDYCNGHYDAFNHNTNRIKEIKQIESKTI